MSLWDAKSSDRRPNISSESQWYPGNHEAHRRSAPIPLCNLIWGDIELSYIVKQEPHICH